MTLLISEPERLQKLSLQWSKTSKAHMAQKYKTNLQYFLNTIFCFSVLTILCTEQYISLKTIILSPVNKIFVASSALLQIGLKLARLSSFLFLELDLYLVFVMNLGLGLFRVLVIFLVNFLFCS